MKYILSIICICCAFTVQSQYLVGDYPFNNDASDASGKGNDGSIVGAVISTDRFGNENAAMDFDGTSAYVDFGNAATLDLIDGFSISAWVNRQGAGTYQTIVSRGATGNGDYALSLFNTGGGYVVHLTLEGETFVGAQTISNGWNHIVAVAETGTDGVVLYLNGELYQTFTTTNDLTGSSTFNGRIGNNDQGENNYFNGLIDDVSLYKKALSANDVEFLYNLVPLNSEIVAPTFGNALDFDGMNDFIIMNPDTLTEVENGFTIEAWVKWEGESDGNVNTMNNTILEVNQAGGGIYTFKADGYYAYANIQSPCSFTIQNDSSTLDSLWHHIAVTVDVENGVGYFYTDGEVTGSIDVSTCEADGDCWLGFCNWDASGFTPQLYGLVARNRSENVNEGGFKGDAQLFTIGRGQSIDFFNGKLDELRIWNYPRSEAEINSNKSVTATGEENGLVYYLNFDQGKPGLPNPEETIIQDQVNGFQGELLGFELQGNNSNWIFADYIENTYVPRLTNIYPRSSVSGAVATIYGANIYNSVSHNKVFFGKKEGQILSVQDGVIKVVVPDGLTGTKQVRVINSSGSSNILSYTIISETAQLPFSWKRQTINSNMTPQSFDYGDMDADGFLDFVVGSNTQLVYFRNNGNGTLTPFGVAADTEGFTNIRLADLDNDGDLDVLAVSGQNLKWYANDGVSWSVSPITFVNEWIAAQPIDMDRDGDFDLVVSGNMPTIGSAIKILENNGAGVFSEKDTIITGKPYEKPRSLRVSDFNVDGFFDFTIAVRDTSLYTFNYDNGAFTERYEGAIAEYGEFIAITNVNNDGLPDIANIGYQSGFNWRVNNGDDTFTQTWAGGFPAVSQSMETGDIDGDGFEDLLLGLEFRPTANIYWVKNLHKDSVGYQLMPISNEVLSVTDAKAVDVDNDGDLDVVTTSKQDNRVSVFFHVFADNDFESFSLDEADSVAVIDKENHTINITVFNDAPLYKLVPKFTLSNKATLYFDQELQISGISTVDFQDSVIYTVRSESGANQQWTVYVNPLPASPIARDASAVTATSFKANWDQGDATSTHYFLEVSETEDFTEVYLRDTVEGAFSQEVVGLEEGKSYWYRVVAGNNWGESDPSNVIFVEQPILIKDLSYEDEIERSVNQTPITFQVTGGRNSFSVTFRHKGIAASNWQEQLLAPTDSLTNSYAITLDSTDFDNMGLVFEIEVYDEYKTLIGEEEYIYWTEIDDDIPFSVFGGDINSWQLFSIPYLLEDDLIETIFSDLAASDYKKDWRLMRYENDKYVDYREGISRIELGKGYWFNSKEAVQIKLNNATVNSDKIFELRLRQGWNQIGNPFNVPISWNKVVQYNDASAVVDPLTIYNSATTSFTTGDIIVPFSGGFVWSEEAITMELTPEGSASGREQQQAELSRDIDADQWLFALDLKANGVKFGEAGIGMHQNASMSKDRYDKMTLPRFITHYEMYTQHKEYFYPSFAFDIVPVNDTHSWLFEVSSNLPAGSHTLSWPKELLEGTTATLWLIDESSGTTINMRNRSSYTFNQKEGQQFSLHYFKDSQQQPVPFNMLMSNPYPNPTTGMATVQLLLPALKDSYSIDLSLVDLQGNQVKTLAKGNYTPGVHEFSTSLYDAHLSEGVYMIRLAFDQAGLSPVYKRLILKY